jgi:hypothetical protein
MEWVEAVDQETNKSYWFNRRTRARTWERPTVDMTSLEETSQQ